MSTYGVGSVAGAVKVHHAVEAGVGGGVALVAMGVEFLLGEDISTGLVKWSAGCSVQMVL